MLYTSSSPDQLVADDEQGFSGGGGLVYITVGFDKSGRYQGGGLASIGGFGGYGHFSKIRSYDFNDLYGKGVSYVISTTYYPDGYNYAVTNLGIYKQHNDHGNWTRIGNSHQFSLFLKDNKGRLIASDNNDIYIYDASSNQWGVFKQVKEMNTPSSNLAGPINGIYVDNDGKITITHSS